MQKEQEHVRGMANLLTNLKEGRQLNSRHFSPLVTFLQASYAPTSGKSYLTKAGFGTLTPHSEFSTNYVSNVPVTYHLFNAERGDEPSQKPRGEYMMFYHTGISDTDRKLQHGEEVHFKTPTGLEGTLPMPGIGAAIRSARLQGTKTHFAHVITFQDLEDRRIHFSVVVNPNGSSIAVVPHNDEAIGAADRARIALSRLIKDASAAFEEPPRVEFSSPSNLRSDIPARNVKRTFERRRELIEKAEAAKRELENIRTRLSESTTARIALEATLRDAKARHAATSGELLTAQRELDAAKREVAEHRGKNERLHGVLKETDAALGRAIQGPNVKKARRILEPHLEALRKEY